MGDVDGVGLMDSKCLGFARVGAVVALFLVSAVSAAEEAGCSYYQAGDKQVYWGDLHVHSGYSLDAWGYGTNNTPAQAYAFAQGEPMMLATGTQVQLDRPLDFMAVTDHAEWFDLLYLCTDPMRIDDPYCKIMTAKNTPQSGGEVFAEYVLPTITKAQPKPTPLCAADPARCATAKASQWQRIQAQTNAANKPCDFTAFVGFEWSATPDYSHNHRNVIFASSDATKDAIDYMRFPSPHLLWEELDRQCQEKDGCRAIAIPHNTNMGDGKSFDVETESPSQLAMRARYERLVEIHQEKGNSECLPSFGSTDEDCSFERYLTKNSRPAKPEDYTESEWERMRGGYARGLLLRGLRGYAASGLEKVNPLQLGIIGSTDNHAGTGGFVEEDQWLGTVFGLGSLDRAMVRLDWNPGGLVAVWAEENTRESLFKSLARREVYATSGPRMRVKLNAGEQAMQCGERTPASAVAMGGEISGPAHFLIQAQYDRVPIDKIEIIKGEYREGQLVETVQSVWQEDKGGLDICVSWSDENFDKDSPAFWYARVLQAPTPRWSAVHCKKAGRCDDFPEANRTVIERAWTSPVWYLPN